MNLDGSILSIGISTEIRDCCHHLSERSEHKIAIMISYLSMINSRAGFYMKTHDERRMRGAVSVPGLILQDNDDP